MEPWIRIGVIAAGGALGANARYWLGFWINRWADPRFPWPTFVINVSGAFVIGFLTVVLARWLPHPNARLLLVVGFLGGYTTFSTFAFESLTLWERGEVVHAVGYVLGSTVAGLAAVVLGAALARGMVSTTAERSTAERRAVRPDSAPALAIDDVPAPSPTRTEPTADSRSPS